MRAKTVVPRVYATLNPAKDSDWDLDLELTLRTVARAQGQRVLFARDEDGRIVGIFTLFQDGSFSIIVHPDHRRKGIATTLLTEAEQRWGPIHWERNNFTPDGAALMNAYVSHHHR